MGKHADKTTENKSIASVNQAPAQLKSNPGMQFTDTRVSAVAQRATKDNIDNSQQVLQLKAYQNMADNFTGEAVQRKENRTGLPNNLKSGVESLSGYSLDDVKVHYNSPKPSQLNAHAYAQGTDIHVAPGQERHLAHEAWHVVQQKQGRVTPTRQLKGKKNINDNLGLEHEADLMGAKAMQLSSLAKKKSDTHQLKSIGQTGNTIQLALRRDVLNVVGENHNETNKRIPEEQSYCRTNAGGGFWFENEFMTTMNGKETTADLAEIKFWYNMASVINRTAFFKTPFKNSMCSDIVEKSVKNPFISSVPVFINLIDGYFKETKRIHPSSVWENKGDAYFWMAKFYDEMLIIRSAIQQLNSLYVPGKKYEGYESFFIKVLYNAIQDSLSRITIPEATIPTLNDANLQRSEAMHKAAQKKAATNGVWKIGDDHVDHIKEKAFEMTEPIKYNLLTKAEFDIIMEPIVAEAKMQREKKEHDSSFFIHLGLPM